MLLQLTSPLRNSCDIVDAFEAFKGNHIKALISVTPVCKHPEIMVVVQKDGLLERYLPNQNQAAVRQERAPLHIQNGVIYIYNVAYFRASPTFDAKGMLGYIMPPERSVDIDTEMDFNWLNS